MCSSKTSKAVSGQVEGISTTTKTALVTPWMLAYGTDDLRLWTELRQLSGNFAAKLGWRTAAVRTDLPGAWNDSATGRIDRYSHTQRGN